MVAVIIAVIFSSVVPDVCVSVACMFVIVSALIKVFVFAKCRMDTFACAVLLLWLWLWFTLLTLLL